MTTIARRRTLLVSASLTIVLTLLIGAGAAAATKPKTATAPRPVALRCFNAGLMDLIQHGMARSATLQDLTSHLERAGVIVYVSYSHELPRGTAGRTRLIAASAGWRYLSTELSDELSRADLLSLLAHELQHAVEIADEPGAVDDASLIALYRRLGADERSNGAGSIWFETQAAINVGRKVLMEVFGI